MAHLHKKIKKGRPYYYIREIARVDGKPKVVNQIYLGSLERMMELAKGSGGRCTKISLRNLALSILPTSSKRGRAFYPH